jgi:S-adenosylmethionine/arginine decarboxylase-like enzyme
MKTIAGTHLLIDGYVRDGKSLNPDTICTLFDRLVDTLNMQYLQRPTAIRVPIDPDKLSTDEDEGGWSVICQITTSHISLHGWPMRGAFMMDVFSCRPFAPDAAERVIREVLDVTDAHVQVIERRDPRL